VRLVAVHPGQDAAAQPGGTCRGRAGRRGEHAGAGLADLRDYRDYTIRHLDDAAQVHGCEQAGATVIKGPARLAGPGRVEAGGEMLEAGKVVIATGSEPARTNVDGLDTVTVWTNRQATAVRDMPARLLLIGGSAEGTGPGTFCARQATIVQRGSRLIDREDPSAGELAARALQADG
jgi:pyruvate/2-oxoglutarate dehydrogenase complex dihydrolipoamide dehydrogenase (E3) component